MMVGNSVVLTTSIDNKLGHISLASRKKVSSSSHNPLALTHTDSGRKLEKLSAQDLKVSYIHVNKQTSKQTNTISSKHHIPYQKIMWSLRALKRSLHVYPVCYFLDLVCDDGGTPQWTGATSPHLQLQE